MKNLIFAVRPLALDLMSTLLFVVISAITHNPMLATGVAMAAGAGRVAWLRMKKQPINAMQWMSLGLVIVFGGATLLTHNARFMMFKPTIVYVLIGAAMLQRGWMLPYMPPAGRDMPDSIVIRWGYVWAGLMFVTAALNTGFALMASFAVWSGFVAVFPAASKIALFAVQFLSIRHLAIRQHRAREAASQAVAA
jgi:intracellular septation protein